MALSRLAAQFAAEIQLMEWSDTPYRFDRAGHDRSRDSKAGPDVLTPNETEKVKINAAMVTAQVLAYNDPNFNVYEFAEACGINTLTSSGRRNHGFEAALRGINGRYDRPGTYEPDPEPSAKQS